jgi:hypothetical protein
MQRHTPAHGNSYRTDLPFLYPNARQPGLAFGGHVTISAHSNHHFFETSDELSNPSPSQQRSKNGVRNHLTGTVVGRTTATLSLH